MTKKQTAILLFFLLFVRPIGAMKKQKLKRLSQEKRLSLKRAPKKKDIFVSHPEQIDDNQFVDEIEMEGQEVDNRTRCLGGTNIKEIISGIKELLSVAAIITKAIISVIK